MFVEMLVVVLLWIVLRNAWFVVGGLFFGVDTPQPIYFHIAIILFCGLVGILYLYFEHLRTAL